MDCRLGLITEDAEKFFEFPVERGGIDRCRKAVEPDAIGTPEHYRYAVFFKVAFDIRRRPSDIIR